MLNAPSVQRTVLSRRSAADPIGPQGLPPTGSAVRQLWRLAALAFLLASCVQGQAGAAAELSGVLLDPTGRPVPGETVRLSGAGREWLVRTSATGEFRFDNVAQGRYRLSVDVRGFEPVRQPVLITGQPLRLVLRLALAQLRAEITVSDQAQRVTTEAGGAASAISVERGLLENLPVLGLDYLTALSRFLDPGTAGGAGASLIVDGMEARNVGVTPSAIQEIRINQNPYTAEYPRWSRRRIEVITKSAADRHHGTLNFLFRDYRLDARNPLALQRPAEQRRIFEGSLFGPWLRSKKMSYLLSAMRESEDLVSVVYAQGPAGPRIFNVPAPQQNTVASLRISRQANDRTAMFWQVNFQDRWQNNLGVGGTVLPEAGAQSRFREDEFIFNHRLVVSPRLLSQFRILLGRYWAPVRSNLDLPRIVVSDAFTGGGAQADTLRTEVHTSITWLLTQTAGRHTLKYGVNVPDWSRRGLRDASNFGGTFFFASLDDYTRGHPFAAVLQRGDGRTIFVEKNLGAFFQDEWQARPNLSVAAGLRFDWQNYFGDLDNWSPRLALAWAPGRSRSTVVRAGAGFFFDRSGPGPIWDILRYDGVRLRRYVLTSPPADAGALEALLAGAPTSIARLQPRAELPEVFQFSAGVERQLARRTTLAVQYVGTRGWHQFRSRDANAPLPPAFAARPDPAVNALRVIESACRLQGDALEVTLRGTLGRGVTGQAQYTFGRTLSDTGGVNWYPADSFNPRGEWGRSDTDRRHQFHFLGTARLHRWLDLGFAVSLQSGIPFNITTGRDDNRDGLALDRPAGITRNTGRGPGYAGVDLRWFHEFRLRRSSKEAAPAWTVSLDAFNVLNRPNYPGYLGALSSPLFGRPAAALPPRRLQAGLRFQF